MFNRKVIRYLLFFFLPIFSLPGVVVVAQQLPLTIYNEKQGIDYETVVCTYQDSKGWIWVSTGNGVFRYEGSNFRYFPPPAGTPYKWIYAFVEVNGDIWAIEEDAIYVIRNQQATLLKTAGFPEKIRATLKTRRGEYYFVNKLGIYRFQNNRFHPFCRTPQASQLDDNHEFIQQFQDSLIIYVKTSGHPVILNLHTREQLIMREKIYALNRDAAGNIWLLMQDCRLIQLKHINWKDKSVHLLPAPERYGHLSRHIYMNFCWDNDGNLWLLADNIGLVKIDSYGKETVYTQKNGIQGVATMGMLHDRENNLWINAQGMLAKIGLNDPVLQYGMSDGLLTNSVWDITTSDNNHTVWTTTNNLQKLHNGRWVHMNYPVGKQGLDRLIQEGNKFYVYGPWKLAELKLNKEETQITEVRNLLDLADYFTPSIYGLTNVKVLAPDTLLIATIKGLHAYVNGRLLKLEGIKEDVEHIRTLHIDKAGYLWAGMWAKGLFQCRLRWERDSLKADIIAYWKERKGNMPPIEFIRALMEDEDGNLWVGTRYNGLFHLQRTPTGKVKQIVHYSNASGLSSNTIWKIVKDNKARLWMATNSGLDMLSKNSEGKWQIRQYGNQFNIKHCKEMALADDSLLWVNNFPGMACINLNRAMSLQLAPFQVAITKCTIENRADTGSYTAAAPRMLAPDNNDLAFELGVNTYTNEQYTRYSYLLEGTDKSWSAFNGNYRVNFSNLQPGSYIFKAKAMNKDGQLSTNIATYSFIINPPYYQRWWFIAALFLLGILGVYLLYRFRLSQIRKQAALELHLAESEMKALRVQMNPHFIFNCMTAIDTFILKSDRKNASRFLNKFSKLIRQVLENSQTPLIDLEKGVNGLELYIQLEQIRFEGRFEYRIEVDEQLLARGLKLPPLLFQAYVENAILHGLRYKANGDGLLEFRLFSEGDVVKGIVRDNGIGRAQAAAISGNNATLHKSMGMKITEEHLKFLKQAGIFDTKVSVNDLYNRQGEPAGTEVTIELKEINQHSEYKTAFEI